MKIVSIGGGPAGLFLAILMKKADPAHDITIVERNRPDHTFGFGVVFSDQALENVAVADPPTYQRITEHFAHWDDIDIHYDGNTVTSVGHGFSGLSRAGLLTILTERCEELGIELRFDEEVSDLSAYADADLILGADGVNSTVRTLYEDEFKPSIDWRPNRFVWLGTTRVFSAFTFYFKWDKNGLWRIHAYQYEEGHSTFIVEATEQTWTSAGLADADEDQTVAFCEELFAEELDGHKLLKNLSVWRQFPTVKNERWHHDNVVLVGDAAHTAHFSIGSGTKLAMEGAIALADALQTHTDVSQALTAYEAERRPLVESAQRAAQVSLQWFEEVERYIDMDPTQFAFNLLTRSFRITYENLRLRDPKFIQSVDDWFAGEATAQSGVTIAVHKPHPPMFAPFRLREMVLQNRVVVSPMCQYIAEDGMPNDWHMVHLGSRAIGGAGLLFTEMTDVSELGRISPGCAGMYTDAHVAPWKRIVDFVHAQSYAKIGMQLGHAGRKGSTRVAWEGIDEPLESGNWPIISPSPIPYFEHSQVPKEMTQDDMDTVRNDFVAATKRVDAAGFDILELHFAHGYLLACFISPLTNTRTDSYGGSLGNRMRFPLELVDAVREVWPAHKPMSVRISAVDWAPGGMQPEDAVEVAKLLKQHDCDITDVSAGQTVSYAKPVYGRQFQTPFSDRIRHEAGIHTMAVGNISSYEDVNTILAAGRADLAVMARAHLWDPYLTRHAAFELGYELPWPGPYESLDRYKPRFT
jgi:anthraniloyl-CoA monooxygenase